MFIQLEEPNKKDIRYSMIGIEDNKSFSGIITDYGGGGVWDEFYFANGKNLQDNYEECVEDSILENDLYKIKGKRFYNSLFAHIKLTYTWEWNNDCSIIKPILLNHPSSNVILIDIGGLTPINVGMTIFRDILTKTK